MTIDFTCRKCEASFEIDADDLIDGTEKLECPNCSAKASGAMVEDFTSALSELKAQVAVMSKKFGVNLAIETEEEAEEEADEDEDEAEEDDADEELDFDDEDEEEDLEDDEDLDEDADR